MEIMFVYMFFFSFFLWISLNSKKCVCEQRAKYQVYSKQLLCYRCLPIVRFFGWRDKMDKSAPLLLIALS